MHRPAPSIEQRFAVEIALLLDRGLSLGDIAKECAVSRQTIWRLAVGDSRKVSWDVGSKVEKGLGRLRGE
ncbi:helix-turn-helix domain-containing protein [Sinorhizobium medicae]|uniref:helix-turn-helix domain-containing protein n=1 Tax=Sinorhizobium medicae TaxID=110321 RepID=UPI00035E59C6|nr:helix-turn-helix domain-containing protein [Sinorhizobium medicae]MDX0312755.1 helix-turn-helix domain-containing protein [Sinorhizobium meliloti]WQO64289.1 helix-turn-helix domain-containing protein [Sinorhizobium medicae]WQO71382.1 helix-turn-helix domain-containing protein [Sinorhizobium medicae]WQO90801.1 helix-turn-helix domain-containing protein [Sinorhizobium medicae]